MTQKTFRIMFAGGCHVLGYPVGMEYGFPQVVLKALKEEYPCEGRCFGYLSFARGERLLTAFREFAPDVLVLQLGHYECPRPLEKILRKSWVGRMLRSPSAIASSSSSSSSSSSGESPGGESPGAGSSGGGSSSSCSAAREPDPHLLFAGDWRWKLRSCTRLIAGLIFECAGQPVYRRNKVRSELSLLLQAIRSQDGCKTIVLSPFLCPDYMIRFYRRRARRIFADAAREQGCVFVDSQQLLLDLEAAGRGGTLYADADHLSVAGHHAVGRQLLDRVRECLPQVREALPQAVSYAGRDSVGLTVF